MTSHAFSLATVLAGAPSTERATPCRVDAFRNTIAYGSGSAVVVEDVAPRAATLHQTAKPPLVCTLHKAPVTAVRFSPDGSLVASGDQKGCVVVFANSVGMSERLNHALLQGPVRDLAWSPDGQQLLAVGVGKTVFGVCVSLAGDAAGTVAGHSRHVFSCDITPVRSQQQQQPPQGAVRAFTGGADSFVGLYEVPLAFKKNIQGHTNTVNAVRYSPAGDVVATASSSAEVLIVEGSTGDIRRRLSTEHAGTIYSLAWSPDGTRLATASADKHVHVLDAASGRLLHKVNLGAATADMQQGVTWTESAGIVAVSLGGAITAIDAESGKVASARAGHQGRVVLLHVSPDSGDLLSVSKEGRLIRWTATDAGATANVAVPLPSSVDIVCSATVAVRGDGANVLYMVAGKHVLRYVVQNSATASAPAVEVVTSTEGAFAPSIAVGARGHVLLVVSNRLVVLDGEKGCRCGEAALPNGFHASLVAAQGDLVAVGGDRAVRIYHVGGDGTLTPTGVELTGRHTGAVSAVAFSSDGTKIASADGASRSIFVWSPSTGEVLVKAPMCHHTAAVVSLAFDEGGDRLLSGGLDRAVIVWDLATGRPRMEDAAHRGGITTVAWAGETAVVSAGDDLCIRRWDL